jgi:flagellar biosynthesis chaperone FliJ
MIDAFISAGGSLLTGFLNNSAASARQDDSQQFSAEQYATRYQTSVKDMQAAGLNPMLAYGGLSGSSPTSSAASSAGTPDLGAAYLQSKVTTAQVANIQADTENKKASADLIEAQALNQRASAGAATASVGQINATVDKIREEIKNIPDEGKRLRQMVQMLADQGALMAQQGETQVTMRKQIEATIAKLRSETTLLNLDVSAAQSLDNLGRTSKELKPVVDIIRGLIRK